MTTLFREFFNFSSYNDHIYIKIGFVTFATISSVFWTPVLYFIIAYELNSQVCNEN